MTLDLARAARPRPPLRALGPGARLAILAGLAVAVVALYLFTDLPGAWEYALGLRGRTVAGMVIAAAAVGASTVLLGVLIEPCSPTEGPVTYCVPLVAWTVPLKKGEPGVASPN